MKLKNLILIFLFTSILTLFRTVMATDWYFVADAFAAYGCTYVLYSVFVKVVPDKNTSN